MIGLHHILDDLFIWTGSKGSGSVYGFWSGFGSDIGEVVIIGGLVQLVRHHNCHVKGCWKLSKHTVGPYRVCRRHHPDHADGEDVTTDHIADAHAATQ